MNLVPHRKSIPGDKGIVWAPKDGVSPAEYPPQMHESDFSG